MLNFVEISHRIENPSMIKLEDLDELRQLAERYPFTAIFSQLYLKGLALHNTIRFESELKNHAYRVPDRSQLFYLVHSVEDSMESSSEFVHKGVPNDSNETVIKEEQALDEVTTLVEEDSIIDRSIEEEDAGFSAEVKSVDEEPKEEIVEIVESLPEQENIPKINEEIDPSIAVSYKTESEEEAITFNENKVEEETTLIEDKEVVSENEEKTNLPTNDWNKLKNVSDLERDILAHAISSSIFIEVDDLQADTYHFEKLKKLDYSDIRDAEFDSASFEFDLPLNSEEEYTSTENMMSEETSDEEGKSSIGNTDDRKSFTSWMSSFISEEVPEKLNDKIADLTKEEEKSAKKPEKKEKNKEFFAPEKRKSEFFSPIKKARESLDESRLPVSETLAKVYSAQGNYPKAIEAYEKLLLKFPEKKSFFALQIETLKRKLN